MQVSLLLTVRISNAVGDNTDLTVHCKSKDDDLGDHVLHSGESFEFHFRQNFGGGTHHFIAALNGQEKFITTISTEQTGMIVANVIGVCIFLAFAFVLRSVFNGRVRPVQPLDHYTGYKCDRMSLSRCKIFIQFIVMTFRN